MIAGTIWNKLVTTLQGSGKLTYIKYVYEGLRIGMDDQSVPCLMIEPVQNGEYERRMNNVDYQYFNVDIYAYSSANYNEFPKAIVGGNNYKGILGIENDIRACLKDSYSLGGVVTDIKLDPTVFGIDEREKYPARVLRMPIRILYRQTDGI